jgi:hypothetical protein
MPLDEPGLSPENALEGVCRVCDPNRLLFASKSRTRLLQIVANHFLHHHSDRTALLEGMDFSVHSAPYRCDLCGAVAERPWWVYTTPPHPDFEVEDETWLVCDGCAELVEPARQGDRMARETLVLRCIRQQALNTGRSRDEVRGEVGPIVRAFCFRVAGDRVREQ